MWNCPARLDIKRAWPVLLIVVAGILFCRQPGAVFHPSFYAEDGKILFKQQYEEGFFAALITPYAGYLPFAPRIVAAICALLPLEYAPAAYAAVSLIIAAAVLAFFIAPGFREVVESDSLRVVIVILFTLMPNTEPLMKLAYLNWYMLFFLALVTLYVLPQMAIKRWLLLLPVVVAAWSTPVALVCLPLVVMRAWTAADRGERLWWVTLMLVMIGFSLAAERAPSAVTMLLHEQDWKWALIHAIGYRVFCFFFLGEMLTYPMPAEGWRVVTAFSLMLMGICAVGTMLAAAKSQRPGSVRRVPLVLFYLILALPAMFVLRKEWQQFFLHWDVNSWRGSGRYFFCSTLLLCVLCGVIYERVLRGWITARTRRRELATVFLVVWTSIHVISFRLWDWHTQTPWQHYAGEIRAAEARAHQSGGSESVHVKTSVADFDFDLLINWANPKRSPAQASHN